MRIPAARQLKGPFDGDVISTTHYPMLSWRGFCLCCIASTTFAASGGCRSPFTRYAAMSACSKAPAAQLPYLPERTASFWSVTAATLLQLILTKIV
jgi:hypothetical protein